MIGIVFSLDYEIFGDGSGNLNNLIVKPTNQFLKILDNYNCKGTIFAEAAEFVAMQTHDEYQYDIDKVKKQLMRAHENGHDIQLHVHSWWKDAKYMNKKWIFNYNSALGNLPVEDAYRFLKNCKEYLEKILGNCSSSYKCRAFRAGGWAVDPSENLFKALAALEISIDSSVYKWGKLNTRYMKFDYSLAPSNIHPWFFDKKDITKVDQIIQDLKEGCLEVPIYAEMQSTLKFLTMKRIRMRNKVKSAIKDADFKEKRNILKKTIDYIKLGIQKRPKKFDFCKCNYREMKNMMKNINKENRYHEYLPVIAIGHSKDFIYQEDFKEFIKLLKNDYYENVEIVTLSNAVEKYIENLSFEHTRN